MDAVIVLIGDELLSGHTRDANGHFLAGRLDALGYRLRRITVIPDAREDVQATLRWARERAPVVLVSGGLGPTHDDRTTEIVADLYGRDLVLDETGWDRVLERYAKRFGGDEPPEDLIEAARKMVTVPEGAHTLQNPVGASTGYALPNGDEGWVIVLPGVPAEVRGIFLQEVDGTILQPQKPVATAEVDLKVAEGQVARELTELDRAHPEVSIGSYPKWGELRVTIRIRGDPDAVEVARREVVKRWGDRVLDPRGEPES